MHNGNQEQVESKIKVEIDSPVDENMADQAEQVSSWSFFNLFTPTASPGYKEIEKKQKAELKRQKDEIKALQEELRHKQEEMQLKYDEIRAEREQHKKDKEAALQASLDNPPSYQELALSVPMSVSSSSVSIVLPPVNEEVADESLSVSQYLLDTAVDDTLVDFPAEDSKISVESSQIRQLEEQMTLQLARITELADEINALKAEVERERKDRREAETKLQAERLKVLQLQHEVDMQKNQNTAIAQAKAVSDQSLERARRAREDAERLLAQQEAQKRDQERQRLQKEQEVARAEEEAVRARIDAATKLQIAKSKIGF